MRGRRCAPGARAARAAPSAAAPAFRATAESARSAVVGASACTIAAERSDPAPKSSILGLLTTSSLYRDDGMPARSNTFQHMIYILERLALDKQWTLRESALLKDRVSANDREIDILIEGNIGSIPIRIAIECIDTGRKANVEWVERMFTKHTDLNTSKLVLVSKNGFTKNALAKANHHDIQTASLEQADDNFWADVLRNLERVTVESTVLCQIRGITVIFDEVDRSKIELLDLPREIIYDSTGAAKGTLEELADCYIRRDDVFRAVSNHIDGVGRWEAELEFPISSGIYVISPDGSRAKLIGIKIVVIYGKESSQILLQRSKFLSQLVIHEAGRHPGRKWNIVMTPRDEESVHFVVSIDRSPATTTPVKVFP